MNKREKIIKTAIRLFVRQGFDNTPTSQIAEKSGAAVGTLFHHFKTKEDLVNECYLDIKRRMAEAIFPGEEGTVKERFRRFWDLTFEWASKNNLERLFFAQFSSSVYITKISYREGARIFRPICDLIDEGKREGVLKDFSTPLLYQVCFGIMGAFGDFLLDGDVVDEGFGIFWDALGG